MAAMKVIFKLAAAALFMSLACGAVAAQDQGPFDLDEGYEIWSVSKPVTPLAYFAYDRAAAAADAKVSRGAKIVVDFSLSLGGQGGLPDALIARYKETGGRADASWLRFGVYALGRFGSAKELFGPLPKPAYIAIEIPQRTERSQEEIQIWYQLSGKWAPASVSATKPRFSDAKGSLQASLSEGRNRDGKLFLIIRLDAWPKGDPYIILPPGWR